MEEVTRKDVLGYIEHFRTVKQFPRTIANRVANVKPFFITQQIEWPLRREDKPKYTEKAAAPYTASEIRQLLAAAETEESEVI